jgi:hypothetical protein
MSSKYTQRLTDVLAAECERVARQREQRGISQDAPTVGLSLSGGGIRSASFGLGLLDAFYERGVLRCVDYLSTVSGGGFIGTALTWARRDGNSDFALGDSAGGARVSRPGASGALSFMRQHSDYLNPSGGFDNESFKPDAVDGDAQRHGGVPVLSLAGVTLRAAFLGTFVYGSMLVGAFFLLRTLDRALAALHPILLGSLPSPVWEFMVVHSNAALLAAAATLICLAVSWLVYPFVTAVYHRRSLKNPKRSAGFQYRASLRAQRTTGTLLVASLGAIALGSVPIVSGFLAPALGDVLQRAIAAVAAMSLGGMLGVTSFRRTRDGADIDPAPSLLGQLGGTLRSYLAAFLLIYGLLVLSYEVAAGFDNGSLLGWLVPFLGLGLAAGFFADLNHVGIARMYRNRLMEAFMPDDVAVDQNRWRPAVDANFAALSSMCPEDGSGPYHLLNANLVAPGSKDIRFRSRGGDSFTLSPLYCGSDATGWASTTQWMRGELTLATAMAMSAAAANPNAAVAGEGITRNQLVSTLMSLLGLRLGHWVPNPDPSRAYPWARVANYLTPGLAQGVLGRGLTEHRGFIELSDGGHFENLGSYELVRRRVDVIIASDAGQDLVYAFDGLATLTERVRVDFDVEIRFDDKDYDLDSLLPGTLPDDPHADRYGLAARGFAVGTIHYPATEHEPEKLGILLYVKPTMVANLSSDVLSYKRQNEDFPQQSTAEQFFAESQFEVYRELGLTIGRDLAETNSKLDKRPVPLRENTLHGAWF